MSLRINTLNSRRIPRLVTALVVALVLGFGSIATASADDIKIGYVDLHQALESIEEGQRLKAQLEREFKSRQERLDQKQQEVMQLREQLEQQAMMLSEDARQQKAMELQEKMGELQQLYMTLQQELAQQEAQATQSIFGKMQEVIQEIGAEKGYTIILERTDTSILYAVDGLDLTDELVRRYNARN